MTESKTYSGGCHCGAVRYDVTMALGDVNACNCSMCSKAGTLLTFVPASAFTLKSGASDLTDYRFNTHGIEHLFCRVCGIKSFARGKMPDGSAMVAVNARCLDGIDVESLSIKHVDGRSY